MCQIFSSNWLGQLLLNTRLSVQLQFCEFCLACNSFGSRLSGRGGGGGWNEGKQKVNPLLQKQNSGLLAYYDNLGLPSPCRSNNSSLINQSKLKQKGLNFNFLFLPSVIPKSSLFCASGSHLRSACCRYMYRAQQLWEERCLRNYFDGWLTVMSFSMTWYLFNDALNYLSL